MNEQVGPQRGNTGEMIQSLQMSELHCANTAFQSEDLYFFILVSLGVSQNGKTGCRLDSRKGHQPLLCLNFLNL